MPNEGGQDTPFLCLWYKNQYEAHVAILIYKWVGCRHFLDLQLQLFSYTARNLPIVYVNYNH